MDFDVVVAGGGLVGASLALALETAGLNLALIEAQPPQPGAGAPDWDSRVYAISPGSATFLERCGVWQELDMTRVSRVEAMCVFGDDGRSELDFSAYDAGLRELAFIVENRELQRVLWKALKRAQHVTVMAPAACRALTFEAQAAQLELGDGRVYAISPGSAAFLERCGVWQELDMTRVSRVEAMCVFGDDGRSELDFSAYDAGLRELAFIVENR
ncbi:MAG: hypothetical protein Q8O70_03325, partial [Burkholderiales bacterium]|nr:hypothetical protein [Burkholderiales bacterium]